MMGAKARIVPGALAVESRSREHRRRTMSLLLKRVAACIVLAAVTSACASTGAVPKPFPMPGGSRPAGTPGARPGEPSSSAGPLDPYALVGTALSLRGSPYRDGGSDPAGFDCSGFTQYVFAQYGVALPRGVRDQFQFGQTVAPQDVAPGDLVFFTTTAPGASHVAIVVGGDEFVHAPSTSGVVRVEHLGARYWAQRFVGARRIRN
jgi:cell wall-associated NlpC family hydrolase